MMWKDEALAQALCSSALVCQIALPSVMMISIVVRRDHTHKHGQSPYLA